jgi:Pyridoxamine 5'-phosphate oxidase
VAQEPEQGDPRLLESDVARRLLESSIPARYAYTSADGTPRVVASWFHWTGEELVMPTFISAPHVRHPAYRVRAIRANPEVAVSIDTESFPPEVVTIRGRAEVSAVNGIVAEYALAAHRYLGDDEATAYLAQIDDPSTRMARIAVRPAWVAVLDFQTRMPSALGGVTG